MLAARKSHQAFGSMPLNKLTNVLFLTVTKRLYMLFLYKYCLERQGQNRNMGFGVTCLLK